MNKLNKSQTKVGIQMGENKNLNEMSRTDRQQKRRRKRRWPRVLLIILLIVFGLFAYAYNELRQTTDNIHSDISQDEERITHSSREDADLDLGGSDSFSILLLGIDTGEMGRVDRGRSDTIMVMTVNPSENRTTLLSIPRDTRTEIVGRGTQDKINHAYAFGGPVMAINSVQNLLDIPIDHYVSVNMRGIQQIVDAVGGITITPSMSFSQSGHSFVEGQQLLMNGEQALAYSRMRYEDPQGDYGRQSRQREVVLATLRKVASLNTILNYQPVLTTMEDNVMTSLAFDEMVSMFLNYRSALSNIEQIQMNGYGTYIDGIYYAIIEDEELSGISQQLKDELHITD